MSDKVDALFAGEDPHQPMSASPRIQKLKRTLTIAIVLDVLGLPCWTSVPGAIMTLWVWMSTESDVARVEAGEYSDQEAAALMQLRSYAALALVFCVVCLILQIFLLSTQFYTRFWGSISVAVNHLWQGV